jgi:hypothetical protein
MAKQKYDLRVGVLNRFLRAYIPQLVVSLPIIITFLADNQEYLPFWVIPVAAFIGAVVTAADKLYRELRK